MYLRLQIVIDILSLPQFSPVPLETSYLPLILFTLSRLFLNTFLQYDLTPDLILKKSECQYFWKQFLNHTRKNTTNFYFTVATNSIFYKNRINLVTLGYSFVDMLLGKTLVEHFSIVSVMSVLTILSFYLFLVFNKWCNWNSKFCQTATLFGNPKFCKLQSKADALISSRYFDWGSFTPIFWLVKGWEKNALHPLPFNSWNTHPIDLKVGIKTFKKYAKRSVHCPHFGEVSTFFMVITNFLENQGFFDILAII